MKLSVLETTHFLYPEQNGLHIYTDGSLMDTNGHAGAENHCNLLSYLTLGQHVTHSDGELEAMNIALMKISCRIWTFKKAVILSAAIQARVRVDAPPSERVSEIDLSVKQFKNLKKYTQFQLVPPHCGVVGNEMGGYFGKKCTNTSRTFACKLSLQSDKTKNKNKYPC